MNETESATTSFAEDVQKLQAKFQSCGYILQLCIKKERER